MQYNEIKNGIKEIAKMNYITVDSLKNWFKTEQGSLFVSEFKEYMNELTVTI